MRRLRIALVVCSAAAPGSAAAYTQQDAQACMGDALRVCAYAIPSHERVRQCLFDNQSILSNACFNVIERARTMYETTARGQRSTAGQGGQAIRPRSY